MKYTFFFSVFLCSVSHAQNLTIAFGSCSHQDQPLPILRNIADLKPDYFVYLGDNIYGDTRDVNVLKSKYDQLAKNPNFEYLKTQTTVLATWDDHDFGENDAGKYYPLKDISKQLFLSFFEEPKNSDRYQHDGIYTSYMFREGLKTVQLILLDTRTFRSDLTRFNAQRDQKDSSFFYDLEYVPTESSDSSMLGNEQWNWLRKQLLKKADVRIIGSSTQFGHSYNGYESWNNFPSEKNRMFQLIQETKANGVLFISGDVHYAELSKVKIPGLYPIYDLTASGISQTWHFATPNTTRMQGPVMENHFGVLQIDCRRKTVGLSIIDGVNTVRINQVIPWRTLRFTH
jgi:alkaline phosphatase D